MWRGQIQRRNVRELALVRVATVPVIAKRAAQLGLVEAGVVRILGHSTRRRAVMRLGRAVLRPGGLCRREPHCRAGRHLRWQCQTDLFQPGGCARPDCLQRDVTCPWACERDDGRSLTQTLWSDGAGCSGPVAGWARPISAMSGGLCAAVARFPGLTRYATRPDHGLRGGMYPSATCRTK